MSMPRIVILGIGNLLWADEGFGVRAVEHMRHRYTFDGHVTLLDGGTQGIYLLHHVQAADVLIIFDAVDYGLPPGTLKIVRDDAVPAFMAAKKMSLHQTGFQEVLAMAQLTGRYPDKLLLIGVQPEEIDDFGGSLRARVKAQLNPAIQIALDYLADYNIQPQDLTQHPISSTDPSGAALDLHRYESERPSAAVACRNGDARFLGRA